MVPSVFCFRVRFGFSMALCVSSTPKISRRCPLAPSRAAAFSGVSPAKTAANSGDREFQCRTKIWKSSLPARRTIAPSFLACSSGVFLRSRSANSVLMLVQATVRLWRLRSPPSPQPEVAASFAVVVRVVDASLRPVQAAGGIREVRHCCGRFPQRSSRN